MRMIALFTAVYMVVGWMMTAPMTADAQTRTPRKIEGKNALYERVLTRPGAKVADGVGSPGAEELDPFTPLYVYERYPVDGTDIIYLEVGTDTKGKVIGYLPETETVPWNHALVLAFAERVNRDRTLFFRQREQLEEWLNADDLLVRAEKARKDIDAGTLPENGPIVSVEPMALIDFEENFYMLPILQAKNKRLKNRRKVDLVEIASVTLDEAGTEQPILHRMNFKDFRAGIVFVIDASSSMGPYIERTRKVMDGVLKKVEAAGLSDKVRFGLVAFRDDPNEVKGIEYLAKKFADPNEITDSDDFSSAIAPLEPSRVSTRAFAEDSFAAIEAALQEVEWEDFGARYLVLITDASSRTAQPETLNGRVVPASETGLSVNGMHQQIATKQAALYSLHLKSPVGKDDHERAETQYRKLTTFENSAPLYFPVEAGDTAAFSKAVEELATSLIDSVTKAEQLVTKPQDDAKKKPSKPFSIEDSAKLIGRAMALRHLGRAKGEEAPSMFRAWASDRDFANQRSYAFSIRVLLSKNQLSDLVKGLTATIKALEAGQIDPDDFFNQLRSAAIAAGRDPDQISQGGVKNMQASGLVGEYLDGLPYESRLMSLSEDDWIAMNVGRQQQIIDEAYSNVRLYRKWLDDSDRWIALNENTDPGDYVYPVPITALP